jgi:mannose-6-phosphate isomerase-like protein (cupin superfamily)
MPVFKSGKGLAPKWCEMDYFDIVRLSPGQTHKFTRMGPKEKLIVGGGFCEIVADGKVVIVGGEHTNVELISPQGQFEVRRVYGPTVLIRMSGRWGEQVGGSGLFGVANSDAPKDGGDKGDYKKTTCFDNHFHDCDEYWIVYEGSGVAVSEGKTFEVGAGDCIVTGMGHHHDFPIVHEPVKAVYFETTIEGAKRGGHLWEHAHGKAKPVKERV